MALATRGAALPRVSIVVTNLGLGSDTHFITIQLCNFRLVTQSLYDLCKISEIQAAPTPKDSWDLYLYTVEHARLMLSPHNALF